MSGNLNQRRAITINVSKAVKFLEKIRHIVIKKSDSLGCSPPANSSVNIGGKEYRLVLEILVLPLTLAQSSLAFETELRALELLLR